MSLADIQKQIPAGITLIAVSKKQPEHRVRAVLEAGHRVFGENRVQEARDRWSGLKQDYANVELHLIGPLQTNKVKDAVSLFDVIHSLDREKLARKLAAEMAEQNRNLPCFIQVNSGEEEQKSGIFPAELPDFLNFCQQECGLNIVGLMGIPPIDDLPMLHFALLKKLADRHGLKQLSMGMSGDFDKAIEMGATHIRVGSAILASGNDSNLKTDKTKTLFHFNRGLRFLRGDVEA